MGTQSLTQAPDLESDDSSSKPLPVPPRSAPGVVVFTSSRELLFMNQEAVQLFQVLKRSNGTPSASGLLPPTMNRMCEEILALLLCRTDAKAWEHYETTQLVGSAEHPILIRGFALPDPSGIKQSRILFIMEEPLRRQDPALQQIQEHFHLTDREMVVIGAVCKGLTNKEIAHELAITDQTVKEHMKRIMLKTHTHTRTGIMAQVLSEMTGTFQAFLAGSLLPEGPTGAKLLNRPSPQNRNISVRKLKVQRKPIVVS